MFIIVQIKFIAPAIEEIPARCKENIPRSTAGPECVSGPDNGGYTVQPVPTPDSTTLEVNRRSRAGGNSQKLKLFILGKAISGAPTSRGINQLPKPPIITGISIKKIIINACAVTTTLYNWWLPSRIWFPGCANSARIIIDKTVPITPEKAPKSR